MQPRPPPSARSRLGWTTVHIARPTHAMHALTRGAARTTRAALDGGVCRTVRWRSTGVAAAAVHEPTTRYDRGAPLATLPLDACMRAGVPHERVTEAHWDCDALPAPAEPAQDAKAVPLADAYVRDVEPVCAEEASSSAAPARPPLWFCTVSCTHLRAHET